MAVPSKGENKMAYEDLSKAMGETIIGRKEAAKMLGVTPITLYRLVRDGKMNCYKIGRRNVVFSVEKHLLPVVREVG